MWKCKKCGCNCFYQDITGGISEVLEMDKDGEEIRVENRREKQE